MNQIPLFIQIGGKMEGTNSQLISKKVLYLLDYFNSIILSLPQKDYALPIFWHKYSSQVMINVSNSEPIIKYLSLLMWL